MAARSPTLARRRWALACCATVWRPSRGRESRWLPANVRWSDGTLRSTNRKEIFPMKRLTLVPLVLAFALVQGCAKKSEQASTTSSDSLLATNPVEQPQGNMTPTNQYQNQTTPPQKAEAPPPAPTRS